ncbi:MAG TPA: NADPH-dependent F420 reductase [Anaerolineales bacterium]|nr:NADPH-dependent F420 reductase [Anaerolineales bacterium]
MNSISELPVVAVVGGTGKEGKGLAYRLAQAGYRVVIGSRLSEKAQQAAHELQELLPPEAHVHGTSNLEAVAQSNIVLLTVPNEAHSAILESIRSEMEGRLLIDATVPLQPGKPTRVRMPAAGSAAQAAREILGESSEVAAAFHTISYEHLLRDEPIDCDVLVTGTSAESRNRALVLVHAAGLRGWDAGPLENSAVTEGLTSLLIHINKKYGSRHAGIRITGVERLNGA